jgi:glutamine synthetase
MSFLDRITRLRGELILQVIADTYKPDGTPLASNKRAEAAKIFDDPKVAEAVPW